MTIPRAGTCRPSVFLRADYHRPVQTRSQSSLSESFIRRARESPRRNRVDAVLRGLDIGLSLVFAALALIPVALISLAIVLSSGRPVLYRGTRVGRGGEFYTMLKFRTLRSEAPSNGSARISARSSSSGRRRSGRPSGAGCERRSWTSSRSSSTSSAAT